MPMSMTLAERIARHPGLTIEKQYLGTGPSPGEPEWECRQWHVIIRWADPETGVNASTPTLVTPFLAGTRWAEDGSGVTVAAVLDSVLGDMRVDAEHRTYESYCEDFGNHNSREKWEQGRESAATFTRFFLDMADRGGDPLHAWLYETELL